MSGATVLWLLGATGVFVAANAVLKTYVMQGGGLVLAGALLLFCVGNTMMVQVMRGSGLGVAISLAAILQLVAISLMAIVVFGERPGLMQLGGMALGLVAVAMIVWPQGDAG